MAYNDTNSEGLTFSEWIQAAGRYKPDPFCGPAGGIEADCAPYSRSYPYYVGLDRYGNEAGLNINLFANGGRSVRRSGTRTFFSKKLRDAWRNGEDPSEYRQEAPKARA
jgi:hypothetical protein